MFVSVVPRRDRGVSFGVHYIAFPLWRDDFALYPQFIKLPRARAVPKFFVGCPDMLAGMPVHLTSAKNPVKILQKSDTGAPSV